MNKNLMSKSILLWLAFTMPLFVSSNANSESKLDTLAEFFSKFSKKQLKVGDTISGDTVWSWLENDYVWCYDFNEVTSSCSQVEFVMTVGKTTAIIKKYF